VGAGGLVRPRTSVVTRGQAQLVRLLLICVAWAIGQVLATFVPAPGADFVVPAVLAIGAYALSDDIGRRNADVSARYWRGRRIDDDRRGGGRLN
jgi:hypothetical protein